jgi:NAD(P)-dependent dehydrogenase (short-subunit alcohol dehydrogenase family)
MSDAADYQDLRFDFSGRVVMVTGGSDGIGLGIASAFARAHAKVVICSRSIDKVRSAESMLQQHGTDILAMAIDVREPSSVAELFAATEERFGGLDVLVNNAGGSFSDTFIRAPLLSLTADDLLEAYRLNVVGGFNCDQLAVPMMRARGSGTIINITSVAADGVSGAMGAYGASKAALNNVTRTMAEEFAPEVRVIGVAPGAIATPRTAADHAGSVGRILMGRVGTPDDVANLVCFLASSKAAWMTGTVVQIDGGKRLGPAPERKD